jgi:hypothetical protein
MGFIVDGYGMSYDDSLRHAVAFVQATTGPLVSRLDPEKLGEYNRELMVAVEYGSRLLSRYGNRSRDEAKRLAEQLVYGYPSHAYIIDYRELKELGLEVELFGENERTAAKCLERVVPEPDESIICLVEPTAPTEEAESTNGSDGSAKLDEATVQASHIESGGDGN